MIEAAVPVLPVRDLLASLGHYRRLGFEVQPDRGGGYGYATRDGVALHLYQVTEIDSRTAISVVYLAVRDADHLHAEWRAATLPGRLREPRTTEYGIREGAHVDPDGNLIRFGSRIR